MEHCWVKHLESQRGFHLATHWGIQRGCCLGWKMDCHLEHWMGNHWVTHWGIHWVTHLEIHLERNLEHHLGWHLGRYWERNWGPGSKLGWC
jgi:hypothetical protein